MSDTLVLDAEGRLHGDRDAKRQLRERKGPWRLVPTGDDLLVLHRDVPAGGARGPRAVVCGEVAGFSLGDLLAALALGRWTGVVRVRAGEAEREIGLRAGRVVQAQSSEAEDALDAVFNRSQLRSPRDLGPEGVAAAVRRQAEEIFYGMLEMSPGIFFLVDGPVSPAAGVDLDLHHLLLEALRRQDEAERDGAEAAAGEG